MDRRTFLKAVLAGGALAASGSARAAPSEPQRFILGAPLTHSDWVLKPGIEWGEPGVRHMLDACKASGWSRVYWRALDGGRALYKSRLMRAQGKWDDDSFWNPKSAADQRLAERFTAGLSSAKRAEIRGKLESLD